MYSVQDILSWVPLTEAVEVQKTGDIFFPKRWLDVTDFVAPLVPLGLAAGKVGQLVLAQIYPNIPFTPPWWAVLAAPLTAILTSILFSVAPARRAAKLDAVQALSQR